MEFLTDIILAFTNLKKNLVRTLLSITGITVGISTLIMVLSIGSAVEALILGQVESVGADTLFVEVKVPTGADETANAQAFAQGVTITTLKESDADAIEQLPFITDSYSAVTGQGVATYRNEEEKYLYWAATASIPAISNFEVDQGRFYSDAEDKGLARVVVLGKDVAENLFKGENPIGKKVKINRISFKVIGIAEERGVEFFSNMDEIIYIPLNTAQKLLLGSNHILFIGIQMTDENQTEVVVPAIQGILRQRHKISDPLKDDFAVRTIQEATDILGSVSFGVTILLLLVAGISLLVGGVGIMNIMYVSVSERTKEIGLLKAIGARRSSILSQFVYESVIITVSGGVIGIFFGVIFSYGIALIARGQGIEWDFIISTQSVAFATITATVIGIIFGFAPAKKAADLHPIDALRSE